MCLLAVAVSAACSILARTASGRTGQAAGAPTPPPTTFSPAPGNLVPDGYAGRFRVTATVLADREHGPQLCLAVLATLPPECGGPDIAGWTWSTVKHETDGGTTWGGYVLTGTFDGHTFTLTEPAQVGDGKFAPPRPGPDPTSPCPAPTGGWRPVDPARATDSALQATSVMVSADPDFGGLWLDQRRSPTDPTPANRPGTIMNDPTKFVLNVRFTKDLARHEADIRTVWGGALCLSLTRHTMAELMRIQVVVVSAPGTYSSIDVVTGTIEVGEYVATQARQRQLDSEYGPGLVTLVGSFVPID